MSTCRRQGTDRTSYAEAANSRSGNALSKTPRARTVRLWDWRVPYADSYIDDRPPASLCGRRRQLDDLEPVAAQHVHRLHQTRERDRLRDEGVHAELVAAHDVLVEP